MHRRLSTKEGGRMKKRTEFSKLLVVWALILTTICIAASYILAFNDHDGCQEITVSVSAACIAIAVAYEAKSYGEKNSRNKYGVDIDKTDDDDDNYKDACG